MSIEVEAETIVDLIRAQNWKNGGVHVVDRDEAIQLVVSALRVAEGRGCIDGMNQLDGMIEKAFGPKQEPVAP